MGRFVEGLKSMIELFSLVEIDMLYHYSLILLFLQDKNEIE